VITALFQDEELLKIKRSEEDILIKSEKQLNRLAQMINQARPQLNMQFQMRGDHEGMRDANMDVKVFINKKPAFLWEFRVEHFNFKKDYSVEKPYDWRENMTDQIFPLFFGDQANLERQILGRNLFTFYRASKGQEAAFKKLPDLLQTSLNSQLIYSLNLNSKEGVESAISLLSLYHKVPLNNQQVGPIFQVLGRRWLPLCSDAYFLKVVNWLFFPVQATGEASSSYQGWKEEILSVLREKIENRGLMKFIIINNYINIIEYFLNENNGGVPFVYKVLDNISPLDYALIQNKKDIAKRLIEKFPQLLKDPYVAGGIMGSTALHFAAQNGYEDIVQILIQKAPELATRANSDYELPIHITNNQHIREMLMQAMEKENSASSGHN